ncbi:Sua5/YciO/YrdC family protein [Parvularcula bermudensis HTCC2503]|uniref:Threonylcarbamoyl-AMP synthase n=1 Tax=Parvularcula bermudensis (strain ATCC BAA-594 / HTCC2503 / KCTC 12087) TaxID=314260 RepID=E0TBR9_PARBH|nr:L-threonylcarbamoyladenylate synthase [Parvularcula bermudensis]ADM09790.1 Sua5/YciO/YrdC family protein [Parvularcula bermudensis HTCC2503]
MSTVSFRFSIDKAAEQLRSGGLVGLPTETVYGLAADATQGEAIARLYEIKGRPHFNPLIVHVLDRRDAAHITEMEPRADQLISRFWPGPLTLVLPSKRGGPVADIALAGLDTVAIRAPLHPVARALLAVFGGPIVAPSANRSGRISPTIAGHVVAEFGTDIPVLDGGPCTVGLESTIVGLTGERPTLLRPGGITAQQIEEILGEPLAEPGGGIDAPGMMASHYAPDAAVRLDAKAATEDEVLLGFGGTPGATLDLSPSGDLIEAAANLFAHMRELDRHGRPIAVAPIPEDGLGKAINDRLRRAAAPRN